MLQKQYDDICFLFIKNKRPWSVCLQSTYIDATNEHKSTKRELRINQLQIKGWGQTMNYEDNHKYEYAICYSLKMIPNKHRYLDHQVVY